MPEPFFNGPLARLLREAYAAGSRPDPWSAEIETAVRDRSATPLCTNCLFPQESHGWFCPHCGFPVGDYVASMPYLQVFVAGEALRRGVIGPPERRVGKVLFLAIYAVAEFSFFAPIYWFWLLRRWLGKPICEEHRVPIVSDENA